MRRMKMSSLIFTMSFLLVLGLSFPVSAGWETDPSGDTTNTGTVGDYDILQGKVELYPSGAGLEEYVDICVQMGTSMPGMLLASFNVDNNTATGSDVSMVDIIGACEGTIDSAPTPKGLDLIIYVMLRDQIDSASTSWCSSCEGGPAGGNGMERGAACPGCDEANCFEGGDPCTLDSDDCYLRQFTCTSGGSSCSLGPEFCSILEEPYTSGTNCALGRVKGEWIANPMGGGGGQWREPAEKGRIDMPLPPGPGEGDEYCFKFPWKRIVENVEAAVTAAGLNGRDYSLAADPANVKKVITAPKD